MNFLLQSKHLQNKIIVKNTSTHFYAFLELCMTLQPAPFRLRIYKYPISAA